MRTKVVVTAVLACIAGMLLVSAPSASAESSASAYSSRLVSLINQARAQHGLRALAVASGTSTVAAGWSAHMAANNTLAHNPNLQSQLESHGSRNWTTYGENVGEGSTSSADKLFTAYMNSPEHKANILGSGYRYLGIATSFDGSMAWNTMDFVDAYGSSTRTVSAPAPVHHSAPVVHHSAPRPVSRPAARSVTHTVTHTVKKPVAATHGHVLARHTMKAKHVHAERLAVEPAPHAALFASASTSVLGTSAPAGDSHRLLPTLLAAVLVAIGGLGWTVRRRVGA